MSFFFFFNVIDLMNIDTSGLASLEELRKTLNSNGIEVR